MDKHRHVYFLGHDLAARNGQIRYEISVRVFDDLSAGQILKCSPKAIAMPISKLEAAQRQLDIAIELYLYEQDHLPVHTLAWATFSILISYDEATNAGGVWAKRMRDNPSDDTRKLANFLKHADRDPLAQLDELTDEYTHHLLLEGCKLCFELTGGMTRATDVFYCYDIALDGDAQDRELDRQDRSGNAPPTPEDILAEEEAHFISKAKLLAVARHHLHAAETTWSSCPPRDDSINSHISAATEQEMRASKARRTTW